MKMIELAFRNFKSNLKSYFSLIISLAFTIIVFFNFQNMLYSDTFKMLGEKNIGRIHTVVAVVSFVLVCFMFFFIWYSSNVFLNRRKKEIGIYIFMGFPNEKVGRLYMIETVLTGAAALGLGILTGVLTTHLFQMITLALSDIAVDIDFQLALRPVLNTVGVYLVIYLIFTLKGYLNITRSSVLGMLTGAKQNEYVRQNILVLLFKAMLGLGVLGTGFYLAVREGEGGAESQFGIVAAAIFVTAGVYMVFGGAIPFTFQEIARNKRFLYVKRRCLWINNVIFRMKKNYRTYAMVCVLSLCSVTALVAGFAMRERYDNIMKFNSTYTIQVISDRENLDADLKELIKQYTEIDYCSQIPITGLEGSVVKASENVSKYALVAYSDLKNLAADIGKEFPLKEPGEGQVVRVTHMYLLSLMTDREHRKVGIGGRDYEQIEETDISYLGYLQDQVSFYMVNDQEFAGLRTLGQKLHCYSYHIEDARAYQNVKEALYPYMEKIETGGDYIGVVSLDPESNQIYWVKVIFSLCIFVFLVFILAGGSIMFMKLYNDSFEEKERYDIMKKMGVDEETLGKSIADELGAAYGIPFAVMSIASCFSVHTLGMMMNTHLTTIHALSVLTVLAVFLVCYLLSVSVYRKNVGV
ncbi:MAG: ABC transporter permease [Lachnospiraceae bacterium]|nr:ABC transporter permease [Lachnospiraceae bacterium]